MPLPIIAPDWEVIRRRIARRLDDNIDGTASGGTATTLTDTGDIDHLPTTPQYLLGAELTVLDVTGGADTVVSRHITTHAKTGGTVTLTVPALGLTPASGDPYEIHKIGGRGFLRADYDNAMAAAIYSLTESYWTDTFTTTFGIEYGSGVDRGAGTHRNEYPMPSGFLYLYGVDYLNTGAGARNPFGNLDTYRALGDVTARTRLFQGFKIQNTGLYEWVTVAMNLVGSPTDNLSIQIHSDSAGIPDGTALTYGTSDNVTGSGLNERIRYVPFRFDPPVYLTAGTQYHLVFIRSGAVDSTNYYRLAEDDDNSYGDGTAGTYNATTYTAVAGSDFCFAIFSASTRWNPFRRDQWAYRRVGADFIYLPSLPPDGTPIRIRGGAALAEPSIGTAATYATETTDITIPPEYMINYAVMELLSNKVGRALPDNYAQALQAAQNIISKPKPRRALPPNTIQVHA